MRTTTPLTRWMAGILTFTLATALVTLVLPPPAVADQEGLIPLPGSDEFDGSELDSSLWSVVRPVPGDLEVASGALTITATAGDLYHSRNNANNIVLQDLPSVDRWQIETKVDFDPTECCQQAGLLLYTDDDNYASLAFSGRNGGLGRAFFIRESGGEPQVPSPVDKPIGEWPSTYYLRLVKEGNSISGFYSEDGQDWMQIATPVSSNYARVGLFANAGNDGAPSLPASFDYFRVYEDTRAVEPPREPGLYPFDGTDEFDGSELDSSLWSVVRPVPGDLEVASGALTITATAGDLYHSRNNANNIVLQDLPSVDRWQIETKVDFDPTECCQQAGLLLYTDDDNYASLAFSGRNGGLGRAFFIRESGGEPQVPSPVDKPIGEWPSTYYLRLVKEGNSISGFYSEDGQDWMQIATPVSSNYARVGLFANAGNDGAPSLPASFDYFRVYEDTRAVEPPREPGLYPFDGTDEFDGSELDSSLWSVVRPVPGDLEVASGALTITATEGDLYNQVNTARNIVLQDLPSVDRWQIDTKIDFDPTECCQQAGLILYTDDNNYASLAFSGRNGGLGRVFFLRENGGVAQVPEPVDKPIDEWPTSYHLRLVKYGTAISAYYSEDGENWTQISTPVGSNYTSVGLFAVAGTSGAPSLPASFDYFRVYEDTRLLPPLPKTDGTVVPIDWSRWEQHNPAGADAIPAQILSTATKYTLGTWWNRSFAGQENAPYLEFGGTGEHHIRPNAAQATALATALASGIYDESVTGVPEDEARARLARLVSSLAYSHYSVRPGGWSSPTSWQGALWAALTVQAAWLIWDDLDEDTQHAVTVMLETEADRFITYKVPYWKDATGKELSPGDTKAEENSWNSMLLQLATAMMPDHPRWEQWSEKNVELLISSHAKPSDVSNDTVVNGRPLADWVGGWNIEEYGAAYNHDFLHPDYMATMVQQLYAGIPATLAGYPTPQAALHNMELIYNHFVDYSYDSPPYVAPGGTIYREGQGSVYYPEGTDWGSSRRLQFVAVDAFSAAFGIDGNASRDGRYWLQLHGQDALDMQARSTDGRTYLGSDDDTYSGREEWVAMHAAWSVLSLWVGENGDFRVSNASAQHLRDMTAPEISTDIAGGTNESGYINRATVLIEAFDAESGVADLLYRLNGGEWTSYSAPLELETGSWTVDIRAVDANGNTADETLSFDVVKQDVVVAPSISLSDANVKPGATVVVEGSGFLAGDQVDIFLHAQSAPLGSAIADDSGAFVTTITIPTDTSAGTYVVVASADSGSATASLTISADTESPVGPTPEPQLPGESPELPESGSSGGAGSDEAGTGGLSSTGAEIWGATIAALILITAGGLAVGIRRRYQGQEEPR